MSLLPVADARALILGALAHTGTETLTLDQALGRVLAEDVVAKVSHPAANVSAMDGYALRSADVARVPSTMPVSGRSAAGHPYKSALQPQTAVRIFTGAHVPTGADTVVIQEDTDRGTERVTITEMPQHGRHIRAEGQDFRAGDTVIQAPKRLSVRDIGLIAASNHAVIQAYRRPRVGILSTGDEVVMPGEPLKDGQLASANGPALCAFVARHGGEAVHLGIARDDASSLKTMVESAPALDMLVTTGGVSVGDHDLVQGVLGETGLKTVFHKVAMRPGKPILFGKLKDVPLMGLPGNPVSALVCATLFLGPALAVMQGLPAAAPAMVPARLGTDLKANDKREDYLRAVFSRDSNGELVATPFPVQDSAMLSALAKADGLIVRPPFAPETRKGEAVQVIPLDGFW